MAAKITLEKIYGLFGQHSYPIVVINDFFQNTGFSTTSGAADYNFLGLAHTKAGNHHYIANLFLPIASLSRSESGNV